ncbi:hypothetical protein [Spirosoma spitsbergense]|uniref:hypothetical protein n=1 Tax=Spirosoma spitsbergense TaxID=431554 RepID=UPI00037DC009|nr:hypothetical protein [Spirosoma spitsbergense]
MNPCDQIDHPLIIFAQLLSAFFLFALFFLIRRQSFPLPQLIGLLGFSILSNAVARFKHYDWFTVSNITMYLLAGIVIIVAYFSIRHFQEIEAKRPGAEIIIPDFFDRIETRLVWAAGICVVGVFVYYAMTIYSDRDHADAKAIVASNKAAARVTQKYEAKLNETSQRQDTIFEAVLDAKLSADTAAILAKKIANESKARGENTDRKLDKSLRVLDRVNSKSIQAPAPLNSKRKVSDNTSPAYENEDTYVSRVDTLSLY